MKLKARKIFRWFALQMCSKFECWVYSSAKAGITYLREAPNILFCGVSLFLNIIEEQLLLNRKADACNNLFAMTAVISRATRSINQGLSSASHEVSDKWCIWISVRKILAFKLVITWAAGVQKGRERSFRARKKRFRAQILFLFLFERRLVHLWKESWKKFRLAVCRDSKPDFCDTGAAL